MEDIEENSEGSRLQKFPDVVLVKTADEGVHIYVFFNLLYS
jgi:hypothetical protein